LLVTLEYARGAGFRRRPSSIWIKGVVAGSGGESSVQYKALLKRRDGSVAEILPYGVDRITGNATSLNLSKAKALFPSVASTLESLAGPIQLLIGMDHMEEAPREVERAQGVAFIQLEVWHGLRYRWGYDTPTRAGACLSESAELSHNTVQPSRVHTRGGHGDRTATQMSCMSKLQGVPVSHGQLDL
jgi:hypothetical protein